MMSEIFPNFQKIREKFPYVQKICVEMKNCVQKLDTLSTLTLTNSHWAEKVYMVLVTNMLPLICQMLCFTFTASTLGKVQYVTPRWVASCNSHKLN